MKKALLITAGTVLATWGGIFLLGVAMLAEAKRHEQ